MGKIYFVRHGESEWNVTDQICGQTDVPLTEKGHKQAEETGKILWRVGFLRILSCVRLFCAQNRRHSISQK